jgi:hypothetical protein
MKDRMVISTVGVVAALVAFVAHGAVARNALPCVTSAKQGHAAATTPRVAFNPRGLLSAHTRTCVAKAAPVKKHKVHVAPLPPQVPPAVGGIPPQPTDNGTTAPPDQPCAARAPEAQLQCMRAQGVAAPATTADQQSSVAQATTQAPAAVGGAPAQSVGAGTQPCDMPEAHLPCTTLIP